MNPKKKREKAFFDMIYRQVIQNAQRKIAEILEYHQICMERFDRRIDEIQALLDDLLETGRAIDSELEYFIKQGVFDIEIQDFYKNKKINAYMMSHSLPEIVKIMSKRHT